MISADGGITTALLPLHSSLFNCFDPVDEQDAGFDLDDKPKKKPETVFDGTGYGSDTFEEPVAKAKKKKATATKKKTDTAAEPLEE